jgi:hypothetical protein
MIACGSCWTIADLDGADPVSADHISGSASFGSFADPHICRLFANQFRRPNGYIPVIESSCSRTRVWVTALAPHTSSLIGFIDAFCSRRYTLASDRWDYGRHDGESPGRHRLSVLVVTPGADWPGAVSAHESFERLRSTNAASNRER